MKKDLSEQEMITKIDNLESELSAIRNKRNRLDSLFNAMNEGVCLHEVIYDSDKKPVDYRIIDVNRAYEKITSIRKEDAVNKNASDVYGTGEAPFLEIYARVAETGVPDSFEVYWPPMKKHFIISIFSPEKGQFGTVFMDITRQKKQEYDLRESKERLSTTLNSIGDGVIATDKDGNIRHMNPVAEELTGWRMSEVNNQPLNKYFKIINQETGNNVENPVFKVIREGKVVGLANHTILISKDGTQYNIDDSASPIKNGEGELIGVVLIFRDITEKYNSENALRASAARLESIFRAAPIGIGLVSERKLLDINDKLCEITGYSKEELIHRNARILYPEDADYDYVGKEKYRQIKRYGTGTVETRFKRKDGKIIDILMSSTPLDPDDLKSGVTFTALDVTEQKKLETQILQTQKMESIGTLAGGIAHDFNNLLSPIMISSELAMMTLPEDSPVQKDLKSIFRAGERARDLVRQILTFARKSDERKVKLHATTVIRDSLKFMRSTIPTTIDIQHEINAVNDVILADKIRLNQVVMNLLTNAAYAMKEKGGVLKINLTDEYVENDTATGNGGLKSGHYLKLSVSDTGEGMPAEVKNKIFEPYFTTKAHGEGTGMGLAVVHGIVKHYEGDITVKSTVGKGTTFDVFLPLIDAEAIDTDVSDPEPRFGSERILYIDDEIDLIRPVKAMLEKLGYTVTAHNNSIQALEIFKNNPDDFDLVITDQTMPNMTGKELAIQLRSIRPDIPVILCTGYSDQINEESAVAIGISAFVLKPVNINDISKIIRKVLEEK